MTHLITSPVDTLLSPLQIVAGVAAKQSTLPILQHALIRKRGGELEMLASNIDMEISARELVGDPSEDFETTLDARKLYSILRALPKRDVTLTQSAEDSVVLKCRRSRFTLRTLPAVDFPRFDVQPAADALPPVRLQATQGAMKRAMQRAAVAMAKNDVRFYLNGLCMDVRKSRKNTLVALSIIVLRCL